LTEIIPTEQVRADQIKEGDRIWLEAAFREIDSVGRNSQEGVITFRDVDGDLLLAVAYGDVVLRRAAPASQGNVEETDGR
jgi:hypothetical protein